jgi:hypothetical protein
MQSCYPLCCGKIKYTFILNTINITVIKKCHYEIRLWETDLVPNISTSLKTTSVVEAYLAAG